MTFSCFSITKNELFRILKRRLIISAVVIIFFYKPLFISSIGVFERY